jgi:L-ribulose-5-phosphate 3-epimerase
MVNLENRIGFMQGRLSELTDGRIQSFPAKSWETEFVIARQNRLKLIEWTIDTLTYFQNPITNKVGIEKIAHLSNVNNVGVPSVTCDYYMENPHWDSNGIDIEGDLIEIIEAMPMIGAHILVLPLVDNSSISDKQNIDLDFFSGLTSRLSNRNVRIAFELDLEPDSALRFIESFNPEHFGINYDIGNSASLGFNPREEISKYGHRILNVHIKDRLLGGSTVPLGLGSADFKSVLEELQRSSFPGNFILQTARATDGDHLGELLRNIDFFKRALIDA